MSVLNVHRIGFFIWLLSGACLAWSQTGAEQATPLPPGGLPELMMKQAGNSALGQKAALRWSLIESWAKMPDLDGTGPFPATYESAPNGLAWVVYRPKDLSAAASKRKLGVYIWGNGGCSGDSVREGRFHLTEIASYGYVAMAPGRLLSGPRAPSISAQDREKIASAPENRATAEKMIAALDWILAENKRQGSPYFAIIDPARVAIAGNSCGGLIALKTALDPRAKTLIMENSGLLVGGDTRVTPSVPNPKEELAKLHTPVLYIVGGPDDAAQPNALDDFKRIKHVPVFLADQPGAGHIGLFMEPRGEATKLELDWLKWQFDGDRVAARTFVGTECTLCTDFRWVVYRKQIK